MRPRFVISSTLRALLVAGLALCAAPSLSGCVYRMNIQQGNYLEPRAVAQLQVGMTRSQVRYLLGTPMVPDAFDNDRWDYLYYLKRGRLSAPEQRHLIVYFKDDKVSRVDNSQVGPMPSIEQRQMDPDTAESNARSNAAS
ncbi:MAG: outer membrane protein assembly factor BamE [Steroidobacteraceae bacterium]|nr:outer membrane protein assembly factor BamE [Steroidobacteraceae bacterium]